MASEGEWRHRDSDDCPYWHDRCHCAEMVESRPDVLGGALTFKGTRLSVEHVGKMLHRGATVGDVMEDYPYVSVADCDLAMQLFKPNA